MEFEEEMSTLFNNHKLSLCTTLKYHKVTMTSTLIHKAQSLNKIESTEVGEVVHKI